MPAAHIRPEPAAEPGPPRSPSLPQWAACARTSRGLDDGEVSLRQVTPPAEEPAAAQPEQEEDILAGLGDLGLDSTSVAEPPKAQSKPRGRFRL